MNKKVSGTIISLLILAVGIAQFYRGNIIFGILCVACAIIQYSQVPVNKK